jgi:hypothetical protein
MVVLTKIYIFYKKHAIFRILVKKLGKSPKSAIDITMLHWMHLQLIQFPHVPEAPISKLRNLVTQSWVSGCESP